MAPDETRLSRRNRNLTPWLAWIAVLACSPERVVLSSDEPDPGSSEEGSGNTGGGSGTAPNSGGSSADGGSGAATDGGGAADGGSGAIGSGGSAFRCTDDNGCAGTQVCEDSSCEPCSYLLDRSLEDCPGAVVAADDSRNGCTVFECFQCDAHGQCPVGKICDNRICVACELTPTEEECFPRCDELGQRAMLVERNGCTLCECLPASQCWTDAECAAPEICFPGQRCDCPEGVFGPECCYGNLCGMPECPPTDTLPCSVVGCPDGQVCEPPCPPTDCWCDGEAWECGDLCEEPFCRAP